jgi:hypothetical protein
MSIHAFELLRGCGLWSRRALLAGAVAALGAGPAAAATVEIDCLPVAADDFCSSVADPCTVEDDLVITAASCAPNFGTRAFVNNGKIKLPNGGSLTLTAGSITTNAKIDGKHTKAAPNGDGTDVTLIAAGLGAGSDVTINKKINTSGRLTPGSITIDADGDVQLNHQIISRGQGGSSPTATGGTISVHADGTVSSSKRGKIVARGKKKVTQAGVVDVTGDLGVDLDGRIEARGLFGGSVAATSASGNVNIEEEIRAYGEFGSGGTVALSAPTGTLTIGGKKGAVKVQGGAPSGGGTATLSAITVDVVKTINARGLTSNPGGTINVTGESVGLSVLRVRGGSGGSIDVTSTVGSVTMTRTVQADGKSGDGGTIEVDAANGMTIEGPVLLNGAKTGGNGGEARFTSGGAADLNLGISKNSKFDATGVVGGVIQAETTGTGDLVVAGKFTAPTGGCIALIDGFDATPTIVVGSTFNPASQGTPCP